MPLVSLRGAKGDKGDTGSQGTQGVPGTPAADALALAGGTMTGNITMPAESFVGPTNVAGIYFKSGNIGIGTTAPLNILHVRLGVDKNIRFADSGGSQIIAVNDADTDYAPLKLEGSAVYLNPTTGGNVGIGTTSPRAPLHINSNTDTLVSVLRLSAGGYITGGAGAAIDWYNFPQDRNMGQIASFYSISANADDADMSFSVMHNHTLTEMVRIKYDGRVGIGTTAPLNLFHVRLGVDKNIRFADSGGSEIIAVNDADNAYVPLKLEGSAIYLNPTTGGNVGIGTLTPGSKLSIVGLPTSAVGLSAGDIYVSAGVLMIVV